MNREDRILLMAGAGATTLGIAAGVAEIIAGTASWAGNKNDPTTLGWVTIGLALVAGGATTLAYVRHRAGAQLAAAAALLVSGLVGLTTAGLAWLPAALASLAAGAMIARKPRNGVTWHAVSRANWAPILVGVLAVVYLAFGVVARSGVGLIGVFGAAVAVAALVVRRRSRLVAVVGLILASVPFAALTLWTVVTPLTAVLMLAIGLPYVQHRTGSVAPSSGHHDDTAALDRRGE